MDHVVIVGCVLHAVWFASCGQTQHAAEFERIFTVPMHMWRFAFINVCKWKTDKKNMTVKYREAARSRGNGIGNFGPVAVCLLLSIWFGWHCLTGSWLRSWVTTPPTGGHCGNDWHTHTHTEFKPSPQIWNFIILYFLWALKLLTVEFRLM